MNSLLRHLFALLCCLHLCGGKYAVVQGLAWAGMAVTYSANDGVAVGLKKTFDGDHPCQLCKVISKAKSQDSGKEKDPKAPQKDPKFTKEILIATSLPNLLTSQRWMGPETILPPAFGGGILAEGPAGPPPRV